MRWAFVLTALSIVGCAREPENQTDQEAIQTDREVLQWLEKVPHLALWGCSSNGSDLAAFQKFDTAAWEAEGRKIPHVESVLRRMLEESDARADLPRVAHALGKVGTAESVPVLIKCLDSHDGDIQMQAAYALGDLRDPRAVQPLGAWLMQERDETLVCCIISALSSIGDESAIRCLKMAANKSDPPASEQAKEALRDIQGRTE